MPDKTLTLWEQEDNSTVRKFNDMWDEWVPRSGRPDTHQEANVIWAIGRITYDWGNNGWINSMSRYKPFINRYVERYDLGTPSDRKRFRRTPLTRENWQAPVVDSFDRLSKEIVDHAYEKYDMEQD